MSKSPQAHKLFFFLISLSLCTQAGTYTWTGSSSNLWNTGANWDLNAVPTTGDALVFPAGAANISTSNDIAAGTSFASITFGAGASSYVLSGNGITLTGNITNSSSNQCTINIAIILNVATCVISAGSKLILSGIISETGGARVINKTGANVLELGGANTYSGGTTISAGTLYATPWANTSFGAGAITIGSGTTLWLNASYIANNIVNNGGNMLLDNGFGSSISGNITNNALLTIQVWFTTHTLSGNISGAGGITLYTTLSHIQCCTTNGLLLSGTNSYTGPTTVLSGKLKAGSTAAFGTNSALTLANTASAILDITGFSNSIGSLAGGGATGGNVTLGAATLTVGGAGTSTSYGGVISGTGALTKTGAGTLTLSGANTYTGNTTISAGTLQLGAAGVIANTSNMVMSGGTFSSGSGAGFNETIGTLTVTANSTLNLGTGSHSINFAASNGASWTAGRFLRVTGWTGGFNGTSGTAGKIFSGSSAELSAGKLAQIYFVNGAATHTATQLSDGEIVPTATLPVELLEFKATPNSAIKKIDLLWVTASEINNDYFVIERSTNASDWIPLDSVNGAGNSNAVLSYHYPDNNPYSGTSYYRLKQIDNDGTTEYSNIEVVNFEGLEIISLFPNPSSGEVSISIKSSETGTLELKAYDSVGKLVSNEVFQVNEGVSNINTQINAADGKYFISVMMGNGQYYDYDVIVIDK